MLIAFHWLYNDNNVESNLFYMDNFYGILKDLFCLFEAWQYSIGTITLSALCMDIQNVIYCVPQKKENHKGCKHHEGERMMKNDDIFG